MLLDKAGLIADRDCHMIRLGRICKHGVPLVKRRGIIGEMLRNSGLCHAPKKFNPVLLRFRIDTQHVFSDELLAGFSRFQFKRVIDRKKDIVDRLPFGIVDHPVIGELADHILQQKLHLLRGYVQLMFVVK